MQLCGYFFIYINIAAGKFAYCVFICNICGREKNINRTDIKFLRNED